MWLGAQCLKCDGGNRRRAGLKSMSMRTRWAWMARVWALLVRTVEVSCCIVRRFSRQQIVRHRWSKVVIESDCLQVVQALKGQANGCSKFNLLVDDV